jgi:hypothetical protein
MVVRCPKCGTDARFGMLCPSCGSMVTYQGLPDLIRLLAVFALWLGFLVIDTIIHRVRGLKESMSPLSVQLADTITILLTVLVPIMCIAFVLRGLMSRYQGRSPPR